MSRHRQHVVEEIGELERKQDELLDKLTRSPQARRDRLAPIGLNGPAPARRRERTCPLTIRVVIAEDEAIIRMDLRETLEEEGYEVVGETGRGDQAVELVRELLPDLAILDIKMPGIDGLEAAGIINRREAVRRADPHRVQPARGRRAGAATPARWPTSSSRSRRAISSRRSRWPSAGSASCGNLTGEIDALGEQLEARKAIDRAKGLLMDERGA